MIQEIAPKIFDNSFNNPLPNDKDYIMVFNEDFLILNNYKFFTYREYKPDDLVYAFKIDDINVFISNLPLENNHRINVQDLRYNLEKWQAFISTTAFHINSWLNNNKFCGKCANPLEHSKSERALVCFKCHNTIYPKLNPAVIVAIINQDKILLTKYNRLYKRYALIAGYCELGETMEETVSREVFEEVGLKVKNIRYYKSQPWALSSSILAGFVCELDGNDEITLDKNELKEAKWFTKEEIDFFLDDISLTQEMIKAFKDGVLKQYL